VPCDSAATVLDTAGPNTKTGPRPAPRNVEARRVWDLGLMPSDLRFILKHP